jgi:nitrile hydratase
VRGHVGTIARIMGCHVYPDSNATGAGENPQWLYSVRFAGPELWGQETDPSISVHVDAWEPYLEPA